MSRPPRVVWGAGGHASVVADAVRLAGVLSDVPAATVVRGVPARIVAPEHA